MVEMRVGFLVQQLNKSEDVADKSAEIVTDEMRDNLSYFMRARDFSVAPGETGQRFFVYRFRVNTSHLLLLLRCFFRCRNLSVNALEQPLVPWSRMVCVGMRLRPPLAPFDVARKYQMRSS